MNKTQTEIGFSFADPTLANCIHSDIYPELLNKTDVRAYDIQMLSNTRERREVYRMLACEAMRMAPLMRVSVAKIHFGMAEMKHRHTMAIIGDSEWPEGCGFMVGFFLYFR
ncbi:hypothetical protein [Oceanobacter sp. 3_MG-2023]|uniref:hypothetical protein n=1 Tax=Oceanobacter sp. 3_MG-2023 TaxID=3062622 RepID=UPI0027356639|nr:hypothetical protein [Oceanobacter sp. 3_MG-2023]MDP2504281.1 hypothetical protein [Oceanobacter sp. 3_MG-2023]